MVHFHTRKGLDQSQARLDQTQAHPGLCHIRLYQSLLVIVDHQIQDQKAQDRVGQAQDQRVQEKEVC